MGTSLSGLTPKDTYPALLKTSDNTVINSTLKTISDGSGDDTVLQLSTLRVGIKSDSTVTTQTSSVIQSSTTNANLVIAPNGTGALIADIPDGLISGGDARGINAVDFQMSRTASAQVASGNYSTVLNGIAATASGSLSLANGTATASGTYSVALGGRCFASGSGSVAIGGEDGGGLGATASARAAVAFGLSNTASATFSNALGGLSNTASSSFSVVSGGQSNTASSGTHATVVGGQSNTSSGNWGISGGQSSTASGSKSIALGTSAVANGLGAVAISAGAGNITTASGQSAVSIGNDTTASGENSFATGYFSSAYLYGQKAHTGKYIGGAVSGNCQISELNPFKLATLNSAATTILSLDGTGTTNLIIPNGNNRLWAAKIVATAFVSVAGGTLVLGDSYMGEYTLLFKKVGGTSSVVGVNAGNIIYDTNMATAAFTFAAGASQDLQITFKAPTTASATTFRCVAKVELVEVAY